MGLPIKTLGPRPLGALSGLSSAEAQRRLQQANLHQTPGAGGLFQRVIAAIWGPISLLLVFAITIELFYGQIGAAAVTAVLWMARGLAAFLQKRASQQAIEMHAQQMKPAALAFRDGAWKSIAANEVVPGDMVYVQAGDLAPGELRLASGRVAFLRPGKAYETKREEARPEDTVSAGSLIQRGEATGEVIVTSQRADLPASQSAGRFQQLAERAINSLAILGIGLSAIAGLIFAQTSAGLAGLVPLVLVLLLAALPVSLPETIGLVLAHGIRKLANQGVLVGRPEAIDETAQLQVVCIDKTGLLTENRLAVVKVRAFPPYDEPDVLHLAAMASDEDTQDPVDLAILETVRAQGIARAVGQRSAYTPPDLIHRHTEAVYEEAGDPLRVIKGTPAAVLGLAGSVSEEVHNDINLLTAASSRIAAVAVGTGDDRPHLAGLVALQDPVRADAAAMVSQLHELGMKVVMVTSEPRQAAQAVARQVGLDGKFCSGSAAALDAVDCDIYTEMLPEDKTNLVRAHQQAGYKVGVTGEGIHDVAALCQADVGIAVAGAKDGARAAAGLRLSQAGLMSLVLAIITSRGIAERMLAAVLAKAANGLALTITISLGLLLSGSFTITPLLAGLLVLCNDFCSLMLAGDEDFDSKGSVKADLGGLLWRAAGLGLPVGLFALGVFWFGQAAWQLDLGQTQTLVFVALGVCGQGLILLARQRARIWAAQPGRGLAAVLAAVLVGFLLSVLGIGISAVPADKAAGVLAASLVWVGVISFVKAKTFLT
jgi:H+-transporting ATPase